MGEYFPAPQFSKNESLWPTYFWQRFKRFVGLDRQEEVDWAQDTTYSKSLITGSTTITMIFWGKFDNHVIDMENHGNRGQSCVLFNEPEIHYLPRFFIIFGNDDFGTNLGTAV